MKLMERTFFVVVAVFLTGCVFDALEDPGPGIVDPNNLNNENNQNNENNNNTNLLNNLNNINNVVNNVNNVVNNVNNLLNNTNNTNNTNNANNTNNTNNTNNANNTNNVIPRGDVCANGLPAPSDDFCNVVTQTGCPNGFCDLTIVSCSDADDCPAATTCEMAGPLGMTCVDNSAQPVLVPNCLPFASAGNAQAGATCNQAVTCAPGLNCTMGVCTPYCQIADGVGCASNRFCEAQPGQIRSGFGFCVDQCS
jgi:hypothetical protein